MVLEELSLVEAAAVAVVVVADEAVVVPYCLGSVYYLGFVREGSVQA